MPEGPPESSASRTSRPAASRAVFHEVGESPDSLRTSGLARRSSDLMDSKLKRPRSHSQPQLTGSLSTPCTRSTSSRLDWMTARQPTEHVVQVVSCCDKSHGRALKR